MTEIKNNFKNKYHRYNCVASEKKIHINEETQKLFTYYASQCQGQRRYKQGQSRNNQVINRLTLFSGAVGTWRVYYLLVYNFRKVKNVSSLIRRVFLFVNPI